MGNVFRGYILNSSKFWEELRRELGRWLPPGGVESAVSALRDEFGDYHYMLAVSDVADTLEEAVKRVMSLAGGDEASEIIMNAMREEGLEPIVFINLKEKVMKEGEGS